MISDFLDPSELAAVGFASVGAGVRVSRHALCFGAERIRLGNHTRVDAFCILSAGQDGISIGRNVHISAYSAVLGQAAVEIGDFATISVRCTIFSSNDDYSGATMANATVPAPYRGVIAAPVRLGAHSLLGAGCIVLPGTTIGESAAAGASSLIKTDVEPFMIVGGVPAKVIGRRQVGHRDLTARWYAESVALD